MAVLLNCAGFMDDDASFLKRFASQKFKALILESRLESVVEHTSYNIEGAACHFLLCIGSLMKGMNGKPGATIGGLLPTRIHDLKRIQREMWEESVLLKGGGNCLLTSEKEKAGACTTSLLDCTIGGGTDGSTDTTTGGVAYATTRPPATPGKLEGNQCRKLMVEADGFCDEFEEHMMGLNKSQRVVGSDDEVAEVVQAHRAMFSALRMTTRTTAVKAPGLKECIKKRRRKPNLMQCYLPTTYLDLICFFVASICN